MTVCWNITSCPREAKKTVSNGGYRKTLPKITGRQCPEELNKKQQCFTQREVYGKQHWGILTDNPPTEQTSFPDIQVTINRYNEAVVISGIHSNDHHPIQPSRRHFRSTFTQSSRYCRCDAIILDWRNRFRHLQKVGLRFVIAWLYGHLSRSRQNVPTDLGTSKRIQKVYTRVKSLPWLCHKNTISRSSSSSSSSNRTSSNYSSSRSNSSTQSQCQWYEQQ